MNKNSTVILLLSALLSLTCCSKDKDDKATSILGTWKLTSWSIGVQMDLNNDGVNSLNLLEESDCDNSETVVYESNGTFSSSMTYNPTVNISLVNGTTDNYLFNVECDSEGTIGLAGLYTQNGTIILLSNNINATMNGNKLTIVYENAIDIYNEDFTEILMSKDLTLIYYKK